MGRAVNISPLGLYNWDQTIFDLLVIPSALDRNTLIDNLLAETAELEVLYPNPVVFKNLLGVWSNKELDVWNRLHATTQYEYNPIENYNRYETGSDSGTGRTTHSGTDTTTTTETHGGTDRIVRDYDEGGTEGKENEYSTENGGSDTSTTDKTSGHWVAGFDSVATATSDGLVKQTRDEDHADTETTYGKTETGEGSETITFGKTVDETSTTTYGKTVGGTSALAHGENVATTNEGEHELHAHGNIGVTTTQKLIREQREVDKFNLYDIIIEDFKMRFCILVY